MSNHTGIIPTLKNVSPILDAAILVIDGPPVDRGALVFAELIIAHLASDDLEYQAGTIAYFKSYCENKQYGKHASDDLKPKPKKWKASPY